MPAASSMLARGEKGAELSTGAATSLPGSLTHAQAIIKDNKVPHIHKLKSHTNKHTHTLAHTYTHTYRLWHTLSAEVAPLNTVLTHVNPGLPSSSPCVHAVLNSIGLIFPRHAALVT